MSEKLMSWQQPDGLWRVSLLGPEAYPGGESRGSGFDWHALAWDINRRILDKNTCLPAVRKAWTGVEQADFTRRSDGVVAANRGRSALSFRDWELGRLRLIYWQIPG